MEQIHHTQLIPTNISLFSQHTFVALQFVLTGFDVFCEFDFVCGAAEPELFHPLAEGRGTRVKRDLQRTNDPLVVDV